MDKKSDEITGKWLQSVESINQINSLMEQVKTLGFSYVILSNDQKLSAIEKEIKGTMKEIDETLKKYEKTIISKVERKNVNQLQDKWKS